MRNRTHYIFNLLMVCFCVFLYKNNSTLTKIQEVSVENISVGKRNWGLQGGPQHILTFCNGNIYQHTKKRKSKHCSFKFNLTLTLHRTAAVESDFPAFVLPFFMRAQAIT